METEAFDYLDAPMERITGVFVHYFSLFGIYAVLIAFYYSTVQSICIIHFTPTCAVTNLYRRCGRAYAVRDPS